MILSLEINEMRDTIANLCDRLNALEDEMHGMAEDDGIGFEETMRLIRRELAERNMTQRELADTLGCTRPSVSLWLRGKRTPPLTFVIGALGLLGYKLVVLPEALPFTPNEGD